MGKITIIHLALLVLTTFCNGQPRLAVSAPVIFSWVEVSNNWSPPTAINRTDVFAGNSFGQGTSIGYSFHPDLLFQDQKFRMNVSIGYLRQRFNLERPFDYNSPVEVISYTRYYAYDCWHAAVGFSYNRELGKNYELIGSLTYQWMRAFRSYYAPKTKAPETNHHQFNFARMLIVAIGINRNIGQRFLVSTQLLAPVYTRWRNDRIFKDDPSTYSKPRISFGAELGFGYFLKKKQKLSHRHAAVL